MEGNVKGKLLDEVGEMPLKAQVRLLRILQDGWPERRGGFVAGESTHASGADAEAGDPVGAV